MSARRGRRPRRGSLLGSVLVAAIALGVLVVAAALVVLRGGADPTGGDPTAPDGTAGPSSPADRSPEPAPPSPTPTVDAELALRLVSDPEAAAAADPEDLLTAGVVLGRGPWRDLSAPAWPMRAERPVYVGSAAIEGSLVRADVVIAHRLDAETDRLILRLLAGAVGDNDLEVDVRVGGAPVAGEVDAGGLLRVTLPERHPAGTAVAVRVQLEYEVLAAAAAPDDSGPAAYGILADSAGVTALGHWLPLLTFEPEPIVPWGDIGSFPPAVWSLQVEHDGTLVTGGAESDCTQEATQTCTWSRGLAIRDLSAVLLDEATTVHSVASGLTVRATGAPVVDEESLETALREAVGSAEAFTRRFGAVAWRELEVVAVPLGQGAAGMEFPGLVMIDDELYGALGGAFGTYVIAHEVAHQWFHALVGNGSFADPVVDEPLAQYLSVLAYRDLFGPPAAEALVDDAIAGRYQRFRNSGLEEEPPGQPSADFAGPGTYGPLIYARAPLAWLAAEDLVGSEVVTSFIATLVADYGLGILSAEQLIADAAIVDDDLAGVFERYWLGEAPVPIP